MEIPLFRAGAWYTCEHPLPQKDFPRYDEWMAEGGYTRAAAFAARDQGAINIGVWSLTEGMGNVQPGAPRYLLEVWFDTHGEIQHVAASGVGDVLDLLARWEPVLRLPSEDDA